MAGLVNRLLFPTRYWTLSVLGPSAVMYIDKLTGKLTSLQSYMETKWVLGGLVAYETHQVRIETAARLRNERRLAIAGAILVGLLVSIIMAGGALLSFVGRFVGPTFHTIWDLPTWLNVVASTLVGVAFFAFLYEITTLVLRRFHKFRDSEK